MGYGIEVFNSNGNVQFSSNQQDSLTVIDTGTVALNGSVSFDAANEILGVRTSSTEFLVGTTNATGTSWTAGQATSWIKLKRIRTQTAANQDGDDTGSYGIECFNSSGEIVYTSNETKKLEIISVHPSGTKSSTGISSSQVANLYSGDLTGVYCCPGRMVAGGPNAGVNPIYFDNFYFDYGSNPNKIGLRSVYGYVTTFPTQSTTYYPYSNVSTIMLIRQKG